MKGGVTPRSSVGKLHTAWTHECDLRPLQGLVLPLALQTEVGPAIPT